ncbi:tRNA (adenosine(37)-N6)-threonylcarbamoyltransferase complex dimerization subunit type 1 TsaB [Cellulomonas sp. S1-8]|uniref:tRNA (adenosine(37)-N6)-threonylcarbamoyltransferase complex dimerization subunit type 1 TsaB n=1 Tax=Cellulomonas sp. S1-8 TaxID=2904790 RepID=UPI002243A40F|nr:tRNA (adenosine(37)-N6)-threonylcarbamoyltransferase complex dimerization subunit type 1 TsaB [Cellulomonas sp. S1-8]UZN02205.1 tRNA (adenosine(37)-N6)-threonylcarbamoyltransferase complex dimerization subunit type 1 TsaB [Cellulomonas sp. S1-8]
MRYLGIDTSGAVTACLATLDGDALTAHVERSDEPRRHAEHLAPMIERALAAQGVDRTEVRGIAVGTGPAPFTGLRAGLVTARVLGLALGVPVWGVPSLDALAAAAAGLGHAASGSPVLPDGTPLLVVTDARRREVYWARYETRGGVAVPTAAPGVAAPADVPRTTADVVLGAGRDLFPDAFGLLDGRLTEHEALLRHPDPTWLVRLALRRAAAGAPQPTDPLYLRRPDAVPSAGAKRVLA